MSRRRPIEAELVNILLGIWLIFSPFLLGFSQNASAKWTNIAVRIALVLVALVGGWAEGAVQGLVIPLGVWLFAAPFVLGSPAAAFLANNVCMAFFVVAAGANTEGLSLPQEPGR